MSSFIESQFELAEDLIQKNNQITELEAQLQAKDKALEKANCKCMFIMAINIRQIYNFIRG